MKIEILREYESNGLITLRPNREGDLLIANYTQKVQYERLWDDVTKNCRGLIVDLNGNIVARPFSKFFNIEEHQQEGMPTIPKEPFDVFEKLDGSLGICFYWNGWNVATRGSFESDQAVKGHELLKNIDCSLDEKFTYLFEIIYPENRIVVDYGDREELILLAVIHTESGKEIPIKNHCLKHAKIFDGINDLSQIRNFENSEDEGFVIRFKSGMRVKVKFSEYVRLHRILTQVSSRSIWDILRNGQSMDEILDRVPDEFYNWVKETKQGFIDNFNALSGYSLDLIAEKWGKELPDRKTFALWAKGQRHPHLLFSNYNGKKTDDQIWKMLKPKFEKPFKQEAQ